MITKYKLRSINRKPELHDKEFVVHDDVEKLLESFVVAAVKAGADVDKIMELVNEKD